MCSDTVDGVLGGKAVENVLMGLRTARVALALSVGLLALAGCGSGDRGADGGGQAAAAAKPAKFRIGVSNTLAGNSWREQMICSVKAQALASGRVSDVLVHNFTGGAAEQIAGIRALISSGAKAIVVDPADRDALNSVIEEADRQGIKVVSVDQAVSAPEAYVATNDQVAYGRLGAEWLFEKLGGKGDVLYMRGIPGVPADEDRHKGFRQALKKYPAIKVVKTTFTQWQDAAAGQQALDVLNSGTKIDGVWTSGIDYTVVNAFDTAKEDYVPVVGADNNEFLDQLMKLEKKGFEGAAVTNPATIGAVGTRIALDAIAGKKPPKRTTLTPEVWDAEGDRATLEKFYDPANPPTYSAATEVKPYTTYTSEQLTSCQGPKA